MRVPRTDMVTVGRASTITEAMDVAIGRGFSRLPVVGDDIDDIVGVSVHQGHDGRRTSRAGHELVRFGDARTAIRARDKKADSARVDAGGQIPSRDRRRRVRRHGRPGHPRDLLEELVGDIRDEFDREEPLHETLADVPWGCTGGFR